MNRERLIKRLVERKMASKDKAGFGCVPCFGMRICFACFGMKVEGVRQPSSNLGSQR